MHCFRKQFLVGFVTLCCLSALAQKSPIDTTISDLSLNPQKFDGQLVRVRALLTFGWEGDNFLFEPSNPNPQMIPASVWFYCKPEREQQVYRAIRPNERWRVVGWFTGYFHFVPKTHLVYGMIDPGPLQFEAVDVSVPEPQTEQPKYL